MSHASTTVAMIYWKYDGAHFGPKGSRVPPEKVMNAVYALVAKVKRA